MCLANQPRVLNTLEHPGARQCIGNTPSEPVLPPTMVTTLLPVITPDRQRNEHHQWLQHPDQHLCSPMPPSLQLGRRCEHDYWPPSAWQTHYLIAICLVPMVRRLGGYKFKATASSYVELQCVQHLLDIWRPLVSRASAQNLLRSFLQFPQNTSTSNPDLECLDWNSVSSWQPSWRKVK